MMIIIVAVDENNAIGKDNKLLWRIPEDMKFFKKITLGHPVIMGRKTCESIGKPLTGRTNIVITSNCDYTNDSYTVVHSLAEAVSVAAALDERYFVIGGASIYRQALPLTDEIYMTTVRHRYDADTFFPALNREEWCKVEQTDFERGTNFEYPFSFIHLIRKVNVLPNFFKHSSLCSTTG